MRGTTSKHAMTVASAAMLVCAAIGLSAACSGEVVPRLVVDAGNADALDAKDPNACVTCASLSAVCAEMKGTPGTVDCPPDLDSPDLYAWADAQLHRNRGYSASCLSISSCPEMVFINFSYARDCSQSFEFEVSTKKLRARHQSCGPGFSLSACKGVDGCLPNRCVPNANGTVMQSTLCPPLPPPVPFVPEGPPGCNVPQSVANPTVAVPPYKPYQRQNACSSMQTSTFYDACVAPTANQATCTAWGNDPNNVACGACLFTPATQSSYGPLVAAGPRDFQWNTAGCLGIVLDEGTSLSGCGATRWAFDRCAQAACPLANCCADTANCTPTELQAHDACKQASYAAGGPCEPTATDLSTKCAALTTDAGAAEASCGTGATTSERDRALAIMTTFCGATVGDAGGD